MPQFLKSLTLKNYRSFEAERIEFDNPTFFVGQNGSGKTNLADAILLLSEIMSVPLPSALARRGGIEEIAYKPGRSLASRSEFRNNPFLGTASGGNAPPVNLGLAVEFDRLGDQFTTARYAFEIRSDPLGDAEYSYYPTSAVEVCREQCVLMSVDGQTFWFDRTGGTFRTNVSGMSPNLEPISLCVPIVGGDSRFSPILRALAGLRSISINPSAIRSHQVVNPGLALAIDGRNAASVLRAIGGNSSEAVDRISDILRTIVPEIIGVAPRTIDRVVVLDFLEESVNGSRQLQAASMSDGTLRSLGLILAIFQPAQPSFLLIEEPEAAIHPGVLGAIMDLIHHASSMMQVVVTTHSPDLLDAKWVEDRHLRVVTREGGSSRVRGISEGSRRVLQKHLMGAGELFRSNALQPEMGTSETDRKFDLFVPIP